MGVYTGCSIVGAITKTIGHRWGKPKLQSNQETSYKFVQLSQVITLVITSNNASVA